MFHLLVCLPLLAAIPMPEEPAPVDRIAGRRPNILFILTDDQGYGDISAHGNPVLKTPNLDRLHDEGIRFTDFHVSPTCSPTRAALLTGRHEFRNGVTHTILERERLAPDAVTLAQLLRDAGYSTGIFGKWHLGDEPERWPDKRGFDEMFIHGCGGIGQSWPGSCGDVPGNSYFGPTVLHNGVFEKTSGYCTDVFFAESIRWMGTVKDRPQPFFCWLATNAPHAPLDVLPADGARYAGLIPDPNVAKFFGMIANIDDNVGRLLEQLDQWGLEKETLVIFMNDNGGTEGVRIFNAGMRGGKGTPWLGGTRASSFWRWPGTLVPASCSRLTAHVDFLPTLAEIAGAELNPAARQQVEGRSLVPLLENPEADWPDRTLFTHLGRWPRGADPDDHRFSGCAVRTTRWHLVATAGTKQQWALFDLAADPAETRDLSSEEPAVVRKLDGEYGDWWASLAPFLVNEDAVPPAENPFRVLHQKQTGGGDSNRNGR